MSDNAREFLWRKLTHLRNTTGLKRQTQRRALRKVHTSDDSFWRSEGANKVAEELARTERNFVLKKDQTTVELGKSRLESQHLHEALATIKSFVPSKAAKTT